MCLAVILVCFRNRCRYSLSSTRRGHQEDCYRSHSPVLLMARNQVPRTYVRPFLFSYFGEELLTGVVVLYSLTWSSLSTLVKLASIMNEVLTHRSFSTNTPLGSGRFCYHLFRAEQRKTQRRRAS